MWKTVERRRVLHQEEQDADCRHKRDLERDADQDSLVHHQILLPAVERLDGGETAFVGVELREHDPRVHDEQEDERQEKQDVGIRVNGFEKQFEVVADPGNGEIEDMEMTVVMVVVMMMVVMLVFAVFMLSVLVLVFIRIGKSQIGGRGSGVFRGGRGGIRLRGFGDFLFFRLV